MQKPYLLCISHRGAMGHAPENSLSSISKALELGAPCLEIDVYYVDGHIIVFHDERLERTTNGTGYLCDSSFEYLRSLDAGNGEQIATLEEVCALIDGRAGLNIELKGPGTAAPVAELISKLVDDGWQPDAFLVSSFDHRQLLEIKQLNPAIKIGVLIRGRLVDDAKLAEDLGAFSIHPSLDCVDQSFVDDAHKRGLMVYVFTVNHPEDIAKMQQLGVDGVFTNYPERVLDHYAQEEISGCWIKKSGSL